MSRFLHRLGRTAFHQPLLFIGAWAGLIALAVGILVIKPPALSNELRIDGTPAQQVIDDLSRRMPQASGGQGMIAFAVPDGQRIDEGPRRAALLAAVDRVFAADHVVDTRAAMAAEMAKGPASALISASQAIGQARAQARPDPGAPQPLRVGDRANLCAHSSGVMTDLPRFAMLPT